MNTSTSTRTFRLFSHALGALLLVLGAISAVIAVTGTDARPGMAQAAPMATFSATFTTEWRTPSDARRALEEYTALVERLATANGGALRVLSTTSALRTRDARGARLAEPLARFERIFEVHGARANTEPAVRAALVAPATGPWLSAVDR